MEKDLHDRSKKKQQQFLQMYCAPRLLQPGVLAFTLRLFISIDCLLCNVVSRGRLLGAQEVTMAAHQASFTLLHFYVSLWTEQWELWFDSFPSEESL